MQAILVFVFVSLVCANVHISNYMQGSDGTFTHIGVVSFSSLSGVLTFDDTQVQSITDITSFTGKAHTSDGTELVLFGNGYTYSGMVEFELSSITLVQVFDESTTRPDQDALLVINEQIMRYIVVSQRSPAEALAWQTANNLLKWRDNGKPLLYVSVSLNDEGRWVVSPVFDRVTLSQSQPVDRSVIADLTSQSVTLGRTGDLFITPIIVPSLTTGVNNPTFLELNALDEKSNRVNEGLLGYQSKYDSDSDSDSDETSSYVVFEPAGGGRDEETVEDSSRSEAEEENDSQNEKNDENENENVDDESRAREREVEKAASSTGTPIITPPSSTASPPPPPTVPGTGTGGGGESSTAETTGGAQSSTAEASTSSFSSSSSSSTGDNSVPLPDIVVLFGYSDQAEEPLTPDTVTSSTSATVGGGSTSSSTPLLLLQNQIKARRTDHRQRQQAKESRQQMMLEVTTDSLENTDTRHHHHHHHHHHHKTVDKDRFSAHSRQRHLFGMGKPPLCGGASVGPDIDGSHGGTLGGMLIAPTTSGSVVGGYRIFAMTDFQVMSAGGDTVSNTACQPSRWVRKTDTGATTETCERLGETLESCCSPTDVNSGSGNKLMDASVIEIDATRYNTMCSVYRTVPDVASPTVVVTDVKGTKFANHSDVVTKYGARSHYTVGTVTLLVGDKKGRGFKVTSPEFPQFADSTPVPVTTDGSNQISPKNDPTFFVDAYKTTLLEIIMSQPDPRTGDMHHKPTNYNLTESLQIFDALWQANRIVGAFSSIGDDGAWVMKGGDVLGVISGSAWVEDLSNLVTIKGTPWGKFTDASFAYDFTTALNFINDQIASDAKLPGLQLQLCTEPARPKPLPADCSTALNGAACNWPRSCRFSGNNGTASCSPWGPLGV